MIIITKTNNNSYDVLMTENGSWMCQHHHHHHRHRDRIIHMLLLSFVVPFSQINFVIILFIRKKDIHKLIIFP